MKIEIELVETRTYPDGKRTRIYTDHDLGTGFFKYRVHDYTNVADDLDIPKSSIHIADDELITIDVHVFGDDVSEPGNIKNLRWQLRLMQSFLKVRRRQIEDKKREIMMEEFQDWLIRKHKVCESLAIEMQDAACESDEALRGLGIEGQFDGDEMVALLREWEIDEN